MEDAPVFRPPKRRKFLRPNDHADTETTPLLSESVLGDKGSENEFNKISETPNMAAIMKMRRQARSRNTGVTFSNAFTNQVDDVPDATSLTLHDPAGDTFKAISDRFVGHTGQVVDVNNHMMAYIDSELAKRNSRPTQPPSNKVTVNRAPSPDTDEYDDDEGSSSNSSGSPTSPPLAATTAANIPITMPSTRNPASLGRIHEIDLGPDAHQRAAQLTSAALLARSNPSTTADVDNPKPRRPRKPRLGRDGKPMKPRPRRQRPSADIARDALVEQVLRESRLELYEGPATAAVGGAGAGPDVKVQHSSAEGLSTGGGAAMDDNEAADERVAEQFRQDFLDAMANRVRRQPSSAAAKAKAKGADGPASASKGPKLGGSRSARAAMREREAAMKNVGKK